jgi:hypothetical protein
MPKFNQLYVARSFGGIYPAVRFVSGGIVADVVLSGHKVGVEATPEQWARLFSAAPDLLEALEQARAALPDAWAAVKCDVPVEVLKLIDAAISKAKGEA